MDSCDILSQLKITIQFNFKDQWKKEMVNNNAVMSGKYLHDKNETCCCFSLDLNQDK